MKYEVVNLKEMTVVGLSMITTNENGKAATDIGGMWQKYISEGYFDKVKHKVNGKGIGLYTDYVGDATKPYRFMSCTEVSVYDNSDQEVRVIESGKYAKFTIKGDMNAVGMAWGEIWTMNLDRSYSSDFEVYHNDSEDMSNQTIDIYIGIK